MRSRPTVLSFRPLALALPLTLALVCGASASAEEPPAVQELRLVTGSWCPFECIEQDAGGLKGFVNDIAVAILSKHRIKTSFVYTSYMRGIELVRENHAEVLIGIAREDAPGLIFPELEQGITDFTFYVRAGNPWRYTGVRSFEQLRKVGTMQGYDYAELNATMTANPDRVEALSGNNNARRNIQKLLAGRFDAIIHDARVTEFELGRAGKSGALVPAGRLTTVQGVYVAFSPKFPAAQRYAQLMSEGTRELRESGELARILARYGLKDWKE